MGRETDNLKGLLFLWAVSLPKLGIEAGLIARDFIKSVGFCPVSLKMLCVQIATVVLTSRGARW